MKGPKMVYDSGVCEASLEAHVISCIPGNAHSWLEVHLSRTYYSTLHLLLRFPVRYKLYMKHVFFWSRSI